MEETKSPEEIEAEKIKSEDKAKEERLRKLAQERLDSQRNKGSVFRFKQRYSHTLAGKTKIG